MEVEIACRLGVHVCVSRLGYLLGTICRLGLKASCFCTRHVELLGCVLRLESVVSLVDALC